MTAEALAVVTVSGASLIAALLGWPVTRLALHLAAGRDRARQAVAADALPQNPADDAGADSTPTDEAVEHDDRSAPVEDAHAESGRREVDDDGLLRGGTWIGILERALVAGGMAVGEPTVLAVVVAVKGLGRVPELLKSPTAGERFIIGSLASLGVAVAVGVAGRTFFL